jgi:hypothetical protein
MAGDHQFANLSAERRADRLRKQQAVFLEHAANLVFDVPADAGKRSRATT